MAVPFALAAGMAGMLPAAMPSGIETLPGRIFERAEDRTLLDRLLTPARLRIRAQELLIGV